MERQSQVVDDEKVVARIRASRKPNQTKNRSQGTGSDADGSRQVDRTATRNRQLKIRCAAVGCEGQGKPKRFPFQYARRKTGRCVRARCVSKFPECVWRRRRIRNLGVRREKDCEQGDSTRRKRDAKYVTLRELVRTVIEGKTKGDPRVAQGFTIRMSQGDFRDLRRIKKSPQGGGRRTVLDGKE